MQQRIMQHYSARIFRDFTVSGNQRSHFAHVMIAVTQLFDSVLNLTHILSLYYLSLKLLSRIPVQPGPPVALLYQGLY